MHIIGVSDSGKSRFMAHLFVSFLARGLPATLIDPHGDLARLVLMLLIERGVYSRAEAFERILYLDLPGAERRGLYMPFNVLNRNGQPCTLASQTMEAFHRAYPELATGAPRFDKLMQHGVKVLISNRLPLPALHRLLTEKAFRDRLLQREPDGDIVRLFRNWYDNLSDNYRQEYIDSTLSRVQLLTFHPILKYSLGQQGLLFDFRRIMDNNQSAIINLALDDPESASLYGCLLTVLAEFGARSRADIPPERRTGQHLLMIDEFSRFITKSGESLEDMLSETRKYGLYSALCHQHLGQLSKGIMGAVQNVGITIAFGVGRDDAEYFAKLFGRVDPKTVRRDIREEQLSESVGMREQWEAVTERLYEQWQQQAHISIHNRRPPGFPWRYLRKHSPHKLIQVKTPRVLYPTLRPDVLEAVEAEYLGRYFRPASEVVAFSDVSETAVRISRRRSAPTARR